MKRAGGRGGKPLTGSEVRRGVRVIQVEGGGLGHLQVHNVKGVLQSCHSVFVHDVLQAHIVYLQVGGGERKGC